MMQHEFEEIAGYEVSYEDYNNIIEPMYMAVNLNKREFVKLIDRKHFDLNYKKEQYKKQLVKEMKEIATEMYDLCGWTYTDNQYAQLQKKTREFATAFPVWRATAEFEKAKKNGCTYVKAIVWTDDKSCLEVKRIDLVA